MANSASAILLAPAKQQSSATALSMGIALWLALGGATLATAGCGLGHHERMQIDAYPPAETPKVNMLVATTRARARDPEVMFTGKRANHLSLQQITVSLPPDDEREPGSVQWPSMGRADPLRSFVVTKYAPVSSRDLKQWVFTESGAKRKLLVFVHGFNTTFAEAVYGFAQIVRDSGAETRPVLFSWPSAGGPLNYLYDVNSATFSRDDLEFVLTRAVNDPNINEIAVMAHSLGNWLLMETLRQMSIRKGRIDPKIKNVIMADPDIDIDVFHKQLDRIGGPRPRTTIFTSRDDKALEISKNLAGNVVRVGDLNPNLSKYRSRLDRYNIVIVDLTKASAGDAWDHAKFDDDPLIIRQIGKRLFADRELWTSRPVEGEQVIGGPIAAIASATISGLRAVGHTEPWERSRR